MDLLHQAFVRLADLLLAGAFLETQDGIGLFPGHDAWPLARLGARPARVGPGGVPPVVRLGPVQVGFEDRRRLAVVGQAFLEQREQLRQVELVEPPAGELAFQDLAVHGAAVVVQRHAQVAGGDLGGLPRARAGGRLQPLPQRAAAGEQDAGNEDQQRNQEAARESQGGEGEKRPQDQRHPAQGLEHVLRLRVDEPTAEQDRRDQNRDAENEIGDHETAPAAGTISPGG